MPSNSQKIPVALSLHQAMNRSAENRVSLISKCLPCSVVSVEGAIITVKFEVKSDPIVLPQVKMPLFGPEYIRYPIQTGDKGFAISADAYLGQMSGLGEGTADLSIQPNLSTLSFMPCGNKNWETVDANAVTIYGPNGVVVRDTQKNCTLTLTPDGYTIDLGTNPLDATTGSITVTAGGTVTLNLGANPLNITSSLVTINGNLKVTGTIDWGPSGTGAATHHHSGVATGIAQSGPPVAGT